MSQLKTCGDQVVVDMSRRKFLQLMAFGGASLLTAPLWFPRVSLAGSTEAILLTCMDYRLTAEIEQYMENRGLLHKFDHVVLAGASLGAVTAAHKSWNTTFWEHLDIAEQLHHIKEVIVMDHRDCGAYKVMLGPEHTKDPDTEKSTHSKQLHRLRSQIVKKHPNLKVETLLMGLDGKVEVIA